MNKKFLSAILFGALVASAGSFVSCADDSEKFDQLQGQNDQLKAELAKIKAELQAELKNAANASQVAAIEAKLAAIEAANAENLQATIDALNGKFVTKEAVDAAIDMQIAAIKNDIANLNEADYQSVIEALNKAKERDNANIEALSAMIDALDGDVNVLISSLRSMVFQPEFYLDGIEAAEYTYLHYVALEAGDDIYVGEKKNYDGNPVKIDDSFVWTYAHRGDIDKVYIKPSVLDASSKVLGEDEGWGVAKNTGVGVPNTVQFAINPANAELDLKMVLKDVAAFTRADEGNVKITNIEKKNGIATITYEIADPTVLITANNKEGGFQADLYKNPAKVNTTVFKMIANVDADVTVESDWGALYENAVQPIAIAKKANSAWNVPTACTFTTQATELHKNPYEALADAPTFKLAYNDEKGVDMAKEIELHFIKRDLENTGDKLTKHFNVTLEEAAAKYGMTYKFIPVPYIADGNVTRPTNYSTLTDEAGVANVKANIVDETTGLAKTGVQGESSVGKQPLYQILVYKGEDVVLDAYVKIIISRSVDPIVSEPLPVPAKSYDCKGIEFKTTWYQFSTIVLQNACKMSKIEFEAKYKLEIGADSTAVLYSAPGTKEDPKGVKKTDLYTTIKYAQDPEETTNHIFVMNLDEYAQQYLIEKKEGKDVIYVKFVSVDDTYEDMAIDPEVFVPIAIEVTDRTTVLDYIKKNINFWYAADGTTATTPDEAIRFNVNYPEDNKNTLTFVRDLNDAWEGKTLKFMEGTNAYASSTKKQYYFHPETNNVKVVDEYDGAVYTLSVQSDEVLCHIWNANETIKLTADKTINDLEAAHKVYVNYGIYNNNELYATVGNVTKLIATLDQVTGIVTYLNNEIAKKVLNAVTHSAAQEKVYIGLVAADPCDHAIAINNNVFPAFFLRPIDIIGKEAKNVVDAKANADFVKVMELFSFVDWRDQPFFTGVSYENDWLFAYYNINTLTVDLANIKTNMNHPGEAPTYKLSDINADVKVSYVEHDKKTPVVDNILGPNVKTITLAAYNKESKGVKSTYTEILDHFGYIKYENKGANVSDFDLVIPVTFGYDWGTITKSVTIHVEGSMANND